MADKFTEAGNEPYIERPDDSKFESESDNSYDDRIADKEFMNDLDDANFNNKYNNTVSDSAVCITVEDSPKFMKYTDANLPDASMIVKPKEGLGRHYSEGLVESIESLADRGQVKHYYQEDVSGWAAQFTKAWVSHLLGPEPPKNKFGEPK